ncbi:MAG TPA: hypothetical protein ENK60_09225 [Anaerolineae bacterium]|nr:hypothetical protein [Anaerolineae bacterium]
MNRLLQVLKIVISKVWSEAVVGKIVPGYAHTLFLLGLLPLISLHASPHPLPTRAAALLASPLPPPIRLQVSAWMPTSWDTEAAWASFRAHASQLDAISPFWYGVSTDGALAPLQGARDSSLLREARFAGVRVIPTISNQYHGDRIHAILTDDALAASHRQAIVNEVSQYDYDGIDLDYEGMWAEDKDRFSVWVQALADDLHARGKLLTITVQPKTFDAAGWDGPGAQDYRALAAAADEMRIMTYGWCWRTGCIGSDPPGPIAPIHWVQRVIDYARSQAPADKLVLGIHLYGYDWWDESKPLWVPLSLADMTGQALVWEEAEAMRLEHNADLQWWEADDRGLVREPWFSYGDGEHTVVFANADSVAARAQLAADASLRGVILWRLGGEDPTLWQRLPSRAYRAYLPVWTQD